MTENAQTPNKAPAPAPATNTDIDYTIWPRMIVAVISIVAIFATHYLWHVSWVVLKHETGFMFVSLLFTALAAIFYIWSIVALADPNKDWTFSAGVVCTVIALAWNMSFLSQRKVDMQQGIA